MKLRFGIHAKLLAIVGVLTTISVLLAAGTWFYLTAQKGDTNTINIAGRQRMLSQKMAKEALLLASGDATMRKTLAETLALFETAHNGLLHGDENLNLDATTDPASRAQMLGVDPLAKSLLEQGRQVLAREPGSPEFGTALRSFTAASVPFVMEMNKAVDLYQAAADRKVILLEIVLVAGVVLTLLVSAATWLVLNHIVTRPIERVAAELDAATRQTLNASQQVSASSQALAQASSEQAANIEETSSAIEEIAALTRQNAEGASKAEALANRASSAVKGSAEAMQRMVAAINAIKKPRIRPPRSSAPLTRSPSRPTCWP